MLMNIRASPFRGWYCTNNPCPFLSQCSGKLLNKLNTLLQKFRLESALQKMQATSCWKPHLVPIFASMIVYVFEDFQAIYSLEWKDGVPTCCHVNGSAQKLKLCRNVLYHSGINECHRIHVTQKRLVILPVEQALIQSVLHC